MRLYGIDKCSCELESVEITKETKKLYKVNDFVSWLGYVHQIRKDDKKVFLTPESAIDNFIKTQQKNIAYHQQAAKRAQESVDELVDKIKELQQ